MDKQNNSAAYKLKVPAIVLMIFSSVYAFVNISRAFYLMGYAAIFWYALGALIFLLPFAVMMAEFGTAFHDEKGGFYSWMEKSVGPKYAFIGIFMWYISFVVWMVATSGYMWIPFSTMVTGYDSTHTWIIAGLSYSQVIGILGIIWIFFLTFVASRGIRFVSYLSSIGGLAVSSLNIILILVAIFILLLNGFSFQQPIQGLSSFFISPNPDYSSLFSTLSFGVFVVFALGGTEVMGGLVDKTHNPQVTFPKALLIAVALIGMGYCLCIFLVGSFVNWDKVFANHESVNMGNVVYVVMNELGLQTALVLGFSSSSAQMGAVFFARITGLFMFLSYVGAFFTIIYVPLRQMIEGTPAKIWPKSWTQLSNDMPARAMWVQAGIVTILLGVITFGGETASQFFNRLVSIANIAMTLPYIFLSFAFIWFKLNDKIEKPFVMIPSKRWGVGVSILVTVVVLTVNVISIAKPLLQGDWVSTLWMIGVPVIFGLVALSIYDCYEKRIKNE